MKKILLCIALLHFIFAKDNYCKKKDNYFICKENNVTFECHSYLIFEDRTQKAEYVRCYDNGQNDLEIDNTSNMEEINSYKQSNNLIIQYKNTTSKNFRCGGKRYCSQMTSCEEAYFYLNQCGVTRLDRDKDGIPCEKLCR